LAYKAGKDNATRTGGGSSFITYEKGLDEVLGTSKEASSSRFLGAGLKSVNSLPISFSPPTSTTMNTMASTPASPITPDSQFSTVSDLTVPFPPTLGSQKRKSIRETNMEKMHALRVREIEEMSAQRIELMQLERKKTKLLEELVKNQLKNLICLKTILIFSITK